MGIVDAIVIAFLLAIVALFRYAIPLRLEASQAHC